MSKATRESRRLRDSGAAVEAAAAAVARRTGWRRRQEQRSRVRADSQAPPLILGQDLEFEVILYRVSKSNNEKTPCRTFPL
jgi:hypothetical protein